MSLSHCDEVDTVSGYLGERDIFSASDFPQTRRQTSVWVSSDSIKQFTENLRRKVELAAVVAKIFELRAIASELFDGTRIEIAPDPEIEDSHYVIFFVVTSGASREVANRRREWYRRTDTILGENCHKVQLLIDISE